METAETERTGRPGGGEGWWDCQKMYRVLESPNPGLLEKYLLKRCVCLCVCLNTSLPNQIAVAKFIAKTQRSHFLLCNILLSYLCN